MIEHEELLTYPQIAARLKLKRNAVEKLVAGRKIPAIRLNNRCVRFRWSQVEDALRKLTVKAL
jgi:excisionase family DNA binding protein